MLNRPIQCQFHQHHTDGTDSERVELRQVNLGPCYLILIEPTNLRAEDVASSGEWLTVQLGVAVICCCLPTYRPLLPPSKRFTSKVAAAYSSLLSLVSRHPSRSMGTPVGDSSVTKLGTGGPQHHGYQGIGEESTVNTLCARAEDRPTEGLYPMHSINVTKSVDMV